MIARLVVTRVVSGLLTLLAVSAVVFLLAEVVPGDIASRVLGRNVTEEQKELFRARLNLDEPVHERYGTWLGGAVQGDFGKSLVSDQTVSSILGPRLRNTMFLAAYALVLYVPVTLGMALIGALFRGRLPDTLTSILTLVGLAMPEFVLGTLLILLFAVTFPVFPALSFVDPGTSFLERIEILTLPAVTLMIVMAVYAIRMLRASLIEVLDSEYVRMATLKGVPRRTVVLRHALPNALGPALNVTALNLTYLIGGVVVVEQVFAYPGIGKLLVDSITGRDTPTTEAVALVAAATYILANVLADVVAIVTNPRLRTG